MDHTKQEIDVCFEDVSYAFGAGFAEILERDGKPFGVSEEIEYTVNVIVDTDNDVSGSAVSGSVALPASTSQEETEDEECQQETQSHQESE